MTTSGKRLNKRAVIFGTLGVLVFVAMIVGISLGTRHSGSPTLTRVASFQSTNEWYESCLEEALKCDFYFSGSKETVPAYALSTTEDNVEFSAKIKSRTDGRLGGLVSNGNGNSFILADGEEPVNEYYSSFQTYQFTPAGAYLAHDTFLGNSEQYADGKCVKVYFTSWSTLDENGAVTNTVDNGDACVVFRTDVAEAKNEETLCAQEAAQCEFYFEGHENDVPEYNIDGSRADVAFSDRIVSRDVSVNIGTMTSTGQYASFILGGDLGEQTMHNYINAFTPYQFQSTGNTPRMMHEAFQVHGDANNKCVKVYFTQWDSLDVNGNVIDHIESSRLTSCAVFQTTTSA